jgi:type I restriction enzyme M protein
VKANVLFFDKKPASETPWTKKLWIYDLRTNMHFTLKTNSLQRSDLDEFVKCYNPEDRHHRKATWKPSPSPPDKDIRGQAPPSPAGGEGVSKSRKNSPSPQSSPTRGEEGKNEGRWRSYGYDELVSRDKASLDIFWLKDESLEASDNLPDPDVIAQEIVEDLEAALEQFREIVGDLGSGGGEESAEK